jgi:hypothetical protein
MAMEFTNSKLAILFFASVLMTETEMVVAANPGIPRETSATETGRSLQNHLRSLRVEENSDQFPPNSIFTTTKPSAARPIFHTPKTIQLVSGTDLRTVFASCDPSSQENARTSHRTGISGTYLYLQAQTLDIPFATPVDGFGGLAVPTGPTLFVDPSHQPGFRVGLTENRTSDSSLSADFWHYQSQARSNGSLPTGTDVFNALLVHPNTTSVAGDSLSAAANFDIDFSVVDLHYRTTLHETDLFAIDLTAGARYARIEQDLQASYSILGTTNVMTDLDFDGVGPRIGLEFERPFDSDRFQLFIRGYGSMLIGRVTADFVQTNVLTGGVQATTSMADNRFIPTTELEIGLDWLSSDGNWQLSGGYYIATYHSALTTGRFIQGVQNYDLYKLEEDVTFSGLMARIEVHW